MTIPQPAAGWYSDPVGYQRERYWDGTEWTGKVRSTGRSTHGRPGGAGGAARQAYSPHARADRPGMYGSVDRSGYPSNSFGRPNDTRRAGPGGYRGTPYSHRSGPDFASRSAPPLWGGSGMSGSTVAHHLSLMPGVLADAVAREMAAGSRLLSASPTSAVLGPRPVPHGGHLIATLLTAGLWSVVWVGHTVARSGSTRLSVDSHRGVVRERLPYSRSPYVA